MRSGAKKQRIVQSLRKELGTEIVLDGQEAIEAHSFDALRLHRGFELPKRGFPPDCIVTPRSEKDVLKVVKLARKVGFPLVPWGGGTGLMGGAVAEDGGVVIDFEKKMNNVIEVNETNQSVKVESGAHLGQVNKELDQRGLVLGHDPWTRDYATVGGAISTNGMGYYGGKYGSMGDQVLAIRGILGEGSIIETRAIPNSSTGFDLKRLFIGTEGTFGLILNATLRCFPKPEKELVFGYTFPTFEAAFKAGLKIRDGEIAPSSLDISGEGYGGKCDFYVVFDGFESEVEASERRCREIFESYGGRKLSDEKTSSYWRERHSVADYYKENISKFPLSHWRKAKSFDFIHVGLPASQVIPFAKTMLDRARKLGITVMEYGCWIKPELFAMNFTREEEIAAPNLKRVVDDGMKLALELGGTIEYCHGVGIRLSGLMKAQHGRGLQIMTKIKKQIDPDLILNPRKLGLW